LVEISRQIEEKEGVCETPADYLKVEKDYWNYVENQVEPKVRV
jgi:hypothetical protein